MITPTSAKSKQYEALGIDEIAEDIETVFTAVNDLQDQVDNLPQGGSAYTETIVNISSAQILAMGTTPVELLPAPGVGKYYDINKIVIEFTEGNTQYTTGTITDLRIVSTSGNYYNGTIELIQAGDNILFMPTIPIYVLGQNYYISKNESFSLTTDNSSSPEDGDGTLRVKIYHKTITFGA